MAKKRTRRTRKKRRLCRWVALLFVAGIAVIGTYIMTQYEKGKLSVEGASFSEDFTGDVHEPTSPEVENFLLLGVDDDGTDTYRTDTMMVASWDKKDGSVKLISFMRDIYAVIPGYDAHKLNAAYALGGVQTLKDTLTSMFDLPIHHYVLVDFERFEQIIDIAFPEGVEIDVEKDMSYRIGVDLREGNQRLNGKELLGYARFRADDEGDFGRVRRQQQVIQAVKDEALNVYTLPQLPQALGAVSQLVATDLTTKEQLSKAMAYAVQSKNTIETLRIPVEDGFEHRRDPALGWVIDVDAYKNKEAIEAFLNGEYREYEKEESTH